MSIIAVEVSEDTIMTDEQVLKSYPWVSEFSEAGQKEAMFQIKKFEAFGFAVPTGMIYEKCKLL